MKILILIVLAVSFFGGCATWQGMKEDASDAAGWSKTKLNDGATYIKNKTE